MEIHTIYIVANTEKPDSLRTLAVLKAWCSLKGINTIALEKERPRRLDVEGAIAVALGGDGTVLRAASLFADSAIPILGANLGSLGFLTQARAPLLTVALEGILRDDFVIEERMRLAITIGSKQGTALNDVAVTAPARIRFCEIELFSSDGVVATYPGDGLVISTATGSTAYSLSGGGAVIVPPMACLMATPIATHRLGLRSVVFPPTEALLIRAHSEVSVFVDGDFFLDLHSGGEVTVERAKLPTRLVRMNNGPSFFKVLEEKLNWGDKSSREG